jgi:predicted MFS family arabinose efflux permease
MRIFEKKEVNLQTIALSTFSLYFGFTVWSVMFNNFAKEVFNITPAQLGIIQSVRELPGLLGFTVGTMVLYMAEVKIATLSIAISGLGLILMGYANSIWALGVGTFVMSVGFHNFLSSNDALLLHHIKTKESAKAQGKIRSTESAAGVIATACVFVATLWLGYRQILPLFGAIVLLAGIYLSFTLKSNRVEGEERKVCFKREYSLYYLLSFLRGCRRHIFSTFAIFLLVANHHLHISAVSILFFVSSLVTTYTYRAMGHVVEKWGERTVLAGSSFLLIFIFSGYAFIGWLPLLIVFYVIDNVLFGSSIALDSYMRKIALRADLTNCLSFSQTANHISAVIIPVLGGVIWEIFGYQSTFLFGAGIVLIDALFSLKVKIKP